MLITPSNSFSPDFRLDFTVPQNLVLAILRSRLQNKPLMSAEYSEEVWRQAWEWSRWQRVGMLFYFWSEEHPSVAPLSLKPEMEQRYQLQLKNSLIFEAELVALRKVFEAAGIAFILLKGIALSQLLYGNASLRPSADIDILVAPEDMARSTELLLIRGYEYVVHGHPWRHAFHRRIHHHRSFLHPRHGLLLELHNKLNSPLGPAHPDLPGIWSRAIDFTLGHNVFPFMCREDLLIYLCLHGANGRWANLLHIYDLAALVIGTPDLDWNIIYERARVWGCRRHLLTGCYLINKLFQIELPEFILQQINRDKTIASLSCISQRLCKREKISRLRNISYFFRLTERWQDRFMMLIFRLISFSIKLVVRFWGKVGR